VATGRSLGSSASALRRIPIAGPGDDDAAAERRRLGREYLAKRNREIMELQEKRGISSPAAEEPPASPTSFDAMVDREGKLKPSDMELPAVPDAEPEEPTHEMQQLEQPASLAPAPVPAASNGGWGWQLGAALANPFGDEFELERSMTPRPPVPPKIKLETKPVPEVVQQAPRTQQDPETRQEELSYEEQMAIAMSLSEAETSKPSATVRQNNTEDLDADLRAAIEASLRDMDGQQAAHAIAHAAPDTPRLVAQSTEPLVDLTSDPPISAPQELPRGDWTSLFDHSVWSEEEKAADPPVSVPPQAVDADEDDLYSATPQLTRARLAVHDSTQGNAQSGPSTRPYDPVHEAAYVQQQQQLQAPLEASFYSAHSRSTSPPTSHTLSDPPQLIDVSEGRALAVTNPTPTVRSRASSVMLNSTSSSEVFASLPAISREQTPPRQVASAPRSEMSDVEVIDVLEDSDVDLLSEEGDGIATPDSWTEVGSQDGESEVGQVEAAR